MFHFVRVMLSHTLPDWAKWTICGLLAFAGLWEGGKWLRRRRSAVR
ncbi:MULTISPECIES: hypothetical protein [unclassified Streptomyces]|nr:hypothetical protein [Streptomyces sp. NBC_01551]MCX4524839.1 hypothetical protein [Streptomyces sp. NBC_01551]